MTEKPPAVQLAEAQEELARRTHTLDLCRQELGATREEADRFGAELRQTREQRDAAQRLHGMWKKTAEDRLGDLTKARDEIKRQDALLTQAYDHNVDLQDNHERLTAERAQLVLDLGNMRGIAQGNMRHVATLSVLLERVEQAEPKMHLRQDGACWPDCPGCMVRAALNTSVTAPVPGSSHRAQEPAADEVAAEMARQDAKWGIQDHPDGTGRDGAASLAAGARLACQIAAKEGTVTWWHVLREEVAEAFAEDDPAKLRAELVQVEAVCAQWRKAIGRRVPAGESRASEPAPAAPKLATKVKLPAEALPHDGCTHDVDAHTENGCCYVGCRCTAKASNLLLGEQMRERLAEQPIDLDDGGRRG